jgi:hypothetical protein
VAEYKGGEAGSWEVYPPLAINSEAGVELLDFLTYYAEVQLYVFRFLAAVLKNLPLTIHSVSTGNLEYFAAAASPSYGFILDLSSRKTGRTEAFLGWCPYSP